MRVAIRRKSLSRQNAASIPPTFAVTVLIVADGFLTIAAAGDHWSCALGAESGTQSIGIVTFVRDDNLGGWPLIEEFGCCGDVTDIAGREMQGYGRPSRSVTTWILLAIQIAEVIRLEGR